MKEAVPHQIDPANPPADLRILAVSYYKLEPKCVHQPCDNPTTTIRATVTHSATNGGILLCVATVCEAHEKRERTDLKRAMDAAALRDQPERN